MFWAPKRVVGPNLANHANLGFSAATDYNSFEKVGPAGNGPVSNPFPLGVNPITGSSLGRFTNVGQDVNYIDQFSTHPDFKTWSLDYQHELGNNVAMTIGYLGSKGSNLWIGGTNDSRTQDESAGSDDCGRSGATRSTTRYRTRSRVKDSATTTTTISRGQLLRPFPQFQNVFTRSTRHSGRSRYDAVKLVLEKRFRGNWGAKVNYTWSNQKDNIYESANRLSDEESTSLRDWTQGRRTTATRELSSRHWLNISGLYRLPSPDGGAAEAILGGWSVA